MRSVDNIVDGVDESETLKQDRPTSLTSKLNNRSNQENGNLNLLVVFLVAIIGLVVYLNRPEQIDNQAKLANPSANQQLSNELTALKKEMTAKIEELDSKINSKDESIAKLIKAIEIIGKDVISQDSHLNQKISTAKVVSIEKIYEQRINTQKLTQQLKKQLQQQRNQRVDFERKSHAETDQQKKAKIVDSINKVLDERQRKVQQENRKKEEKEKEKIRKIEARKAEAEDKIKELNAIREEDFIQLSSNVTETQMARLLKIKQDQDKLNERRNQIVRSTNRLVPGQNLFRDRLNEEWTEPTLGSPTSDTEFNFTEVQQTEYSQFEKRIEVLMKPFNDTNCDLTRYGNKDRDGGYLVCKNFVSKDSALINIGIKDSDEFGCDFTTAHPMNNIQYDCTDILDAGSCSSNSNRNLQKLICLADQTQTFEKLEYMSLKDMIDVNDLTKKHILVKINAEGAQWGALRTLPIRYLESIDQLFIEFHLNKFEKMYWGYADVIERLSRSFVSVSFNENNEDCYQSVTAGKDKQHIFTSATFEITLINRNRIKLNSETRSYKKQAINLVSFPELQQRCFMQP